MNNELEIVEFGNNVRPTDSTGMDSSTFSEVTGIVTK